MHEKSIVEQDAQRVRVARWLVPWIKNAHDMAVDAARLLHYLGISRTAKGYPPAFLMEIGAVARIASWEQGGIKDRISPDLPSSQDALADLAQRLQSLPKRGEDVGTSLSEQVLFAWTFHCARDSRTELGIDIVLERPDKEQLLDCLAQLLWDHRHLLDGSNT